MHLGRTTKMANMFASRERPSGSLVIVFVSIFGPGVLQCLYPKTGSKRKQIMAFILKRVRTLALIVLCSPGAYAFQNATVLAAEPFSSAAGPLNAANGGAGWGGAWQVQNG